jgi:hypothetical protein
MVTNYGYFCRFAVLALIFGLTIAVPFRNLVPRRLDPSQPDEIEDFEVNEDEDDPESIVIDGPNSEEGDEFPDSPPSSEIGSEEGNDGEHYTKRQQSRLERLSSNYEQLTAQESQMYANLHMGEANQAETQSNIKENEADARDLQRFSNYLAYLADEQKKFAEELKENGAGEDAEQEAKIGEILEEMSGIAASNSELERDAAATAERQIELESNIRREQEDVVMLKSEQSELQLDQIYLERTMIGNEHHFGELHRKLIGEAIEDNEGNFIGTENESQDGGAEAQETTETENEDQSEVAVASSPVEQPAAQALKNCKDLTINCIE